MKYFLHISYDGRKYSGWQLQLNVPSIQGKLENALSRIFKKEIRVYGCGRTDAGVHASQYFLHVIIDEVFDFDLKFRMNKNLPGDIVIHDVIEMKGKENARFDAVSRTYDYFLHSSKDPILDNYSTLVDFKCLNIEAMKSAVELISQQTDFKSVCKQPDLHNNTLCDIYEATLLLDKKNERMCFSITANRFLRGMIRLCVYFLLEVGRGDMTIEEFNQLLSDEIIKEQIKPAPANGLFLSGVKYPFMSIEPVKGISSLLRAGLY